MVLFLGCWLMLLQVILNVAILMKRQELKNSILQCCGINEWSTLEGQVCPRWWLEKLPKEILVAQWDWDLVNNVYKAKIRVNFQSSDMRTSEISELIHSDVFGYYISFTDDFSQHHWIYFRWIKSEALDKFREFKFLIENQLDRKILPPNNEGEFCHDWFEQFCVAPRIARQKTTPCKP